MPSPYEQGALIAAPWAAVGKQLFQGQGAYEAGRTKMAQALAQQEQMQAHADALRSQAGLNNEKTQEIQRRAAMQTPEFATKAAQAFAGFTDPQAQQVNDYYTRGSFVQDLPSGQEGPPVPTQTPSFFTPEAKSKFDMARTAQLLGLGATGNTNGEQLADAIGKLQGQGRIDRAIVDPNYRKALGPTMAAIAGKGEFNNLGTNGVFNQFSGDQQLNEVGKSAAIENRAQAGNASASAALHRAQIPEVQSRIDLNKSKIQAPIILTDKDGNQSVYDPKAKGQGKPPTEFQGKSATYGARAKEAHDIMNELESLSGNDAYNRIAVATVGGSGALNTVANPYLSENTQRAIQARRDFINAVLRQESGAAISPSEFDNANRQYFPMPGDSKKTIEQKARTRETAILGLNKSAGPAQFDAPPIVSNSSALSSVPPAAIEYLKSNPSQINAFAAKYGKEAADAALGKAR